MKNIAALLALILLGACSSDKKSGSASGNKIITANDFESVAGWNVDPLILDRGRAHSGQYAIKVDASHEFSLTFDMALGMATPSKIKKLHLEAWAFLPSNKATGVLGIQLMGGPSNSDMLYGDGIQLGQEVKTYNKWVKVSKEFTLPDNITAAQHIRLSLWRADASDFVLVDDIELSIKE
ncbi:hypothetical protein IC235_03150 [Hymenobacter sp. BT664]|uniref:CBM-cenC domain-containing protein n=1 Tax=Hymenobacter montanus TaxID=2771359 RepID=A0A927GI04_9BACT|nr:hypothetical protein [Hymenobacter montanus]MBD2766887.1 hypothetical protein [Hymenobacter montanus]